MDFTFSEQDEFLRKTARSFALSKLLPEMPRWRSERTVVPNSALATPPGPRRAGQSAIPTPPDFPPQHYLRGPTKKVRGGSEALARLRSRGRGTTVSWDRQLVALEGHSSL